MFNFGRRLVLFCPALWLTLLLPDLAKAGDGQPKATPLAKLSSWGGHAFQKNGGAVLPETNSLFSAEELRNFKRIANEHSGDAENIEQLTRVVDVDLAWGSTFLSPYDQDSVLVGALRRHVHTSIKSLDLGGRPLFHLRTHLRSGPELHARSHVHPDVVVLVHPLNQVTVGTVFEKTKGGLLTMPSKITTAIGTSFHRAPNTQIARHSLFSIFGFKPSKAQTANSARNATANRVYDWHGEKVRPRRARSSRGRR